MPAGIDFVFQAIFNQHGSEGLPVQVHFSKITLRRYWLIISTLGLGLVLGLGLGLGLGLALGSELRLGLGLGLGLWLGSGSGLGLGRLWGLH